MLSVCVIIAAYCLFAGLYDRQYKKFTKKRDWLIGVITLSAGIFSGTFTSAYYLDGWNVKYLAPILLFSVATAAVIAYTCLLKKIYAAKGKGDGQSKEIEDKNEKQ